MEQQRGELMARLDSLGDKAREHPAHKRVLTLLNVTFRKTKLAQRLAVLQAAAWLMNVLENLTSIV